MFRGHRDVRIPNIYYRSAFVTAISKDANLRSAEVWPITPQQSEIFIKEDMMPNLQYLHKPLCFIQYKYNPECSLCTDIKEHRSDLGLSESEVEAGNLVIVNAGLKVDSYSNGERYAELAVLPGITQVYRHELLACDSLHQDPPGTHSVKFEFGLNGGLPMVKDIGKGERTISLPYFPDPDDKLRCQVFESNTLDKLTLHQLKRFEDRHLEIISETSQ